MSEETQTGVDNATVAGEQQQDEFNLEDILAEEYTGAEEPAVAGQDAGSGKVSEGEQQGGAVVDERTEQAFAKRLAAEREKIKRELENEYKSKQTEQVAPLPATPPPLPKDQLEKLSYELGVTEEAVQVLYHQQYQLNLNNELVRKQQQYIRHMEEAATKTRVKTEIDRQRASNPLLPEFDESRIAQIRNEYQSAYGYELPWKEAYNKFIAEEAIKGNLLRQVEQKTVQQVASRGARAVQVGKGGRAATRPGIEDLPLEEFNALVEKAKAGKFKRS